MSQWKKKIAHELLALSLCICVLCALSVKVFAAEHSNHDGIAFETAISTSDELLSLVANGGTGYLTSDITLAYCAVIKANVKVTLCLNGYTINMSTKQNNSMFSVANGGELNIYDCDNETVRYFKDEKYYNISYSYPYYISSVGSGTNGAYETCYTERPSEGIYKTVKGGALYGAATTAGGAILNYGTVNMYGGTIIGCYSSQSGAAIYNDTTGKLTLENVDIIGNFGRAKNASNGAAVFNYGTITIKGDTIISGNDYSDIYLPANKIITLSDDFNGFIGVRTEAKASAESYVAISSENKSDLSGKVFSNDSAYDIISEGNVLKLCPDRDTATAYTITGDNKVSADKTQAYPGETITMTAHPEEDYIVNKYYVNGVAQTGNTFIMPAGNVTITADFLCTMPKPQADFRTFRYSGSVNKYYPLYYNSSTNQYFSANGLFYDVYNDTRTEPGTQTVTVRLHEGYAWSDGSTSDLTFDFTVKKGLQSAAYAYFLKDTMTGNTVIGYLDDYYKIDFYKPENTKVWNRYIPNVLNVRDNAKVTVKYSRYKKKYWQEQYASQVKDWFSDDNTYDSTAGEIVTDDLGGGSSTSYRDDGLRYMTIEIAETDHYEGLTIYPEDANGKYATFKISSPSITTKTYRYNPYLDKNNKDGAPEINILSQQYAFMYGQGGTQTAELMKERHLSSTTEAVNEANKDIKAGNLAVDIVLSGSKKIRMSKKGYAQLSSGNLTSAVYLSGNETDSVNYSLAGKLGNLDFSQMEDISEIMADEIVGDELLDEECAIEDIELSEEAVDPVVGDEIIELEESIVIGEGQTINFDLGDCELDLSDMGDLSLFTVESGASLIVRASGDGKVLSDGDGIFIKVEEGGSLIVTDSDILPESAVENNGDIYYSVVLDASYGDTQYAGVLTVKLGEKITKPVNPEREGYLFGGWYKDPELTQKWNFDAVLTEADISEGNLYLYGKWMEESSHKHSVDITDDEISEGGTAEGSEDMTCDCGYTLDQFYTIAQDGETEYTDVKCVKVEWETSVINSKYAKKKTWNANSRKWDTQTTQKDNAKGGARFTLTNYSSTAVLAEIAFTAKPEMEDKIDSVLFADDADATDGYKTVLELSTPVTREADEFAENLFTPVSTSAEITVKTGAFNGNSTAGNEKFGTYTIRISE